MIPVTLDQIEKVYFKKNVKLLKNKLTYTYIYLLTAQHTYGHTKYNIYIHTYNKKIYIYILYTIR